MKTKSYLVIIATLFSLFGNLHAQSVKPATTLPDISLIGNFQATHADSGNAFDVKEIELSLQHYLYPSVKADVFLALHKEENGERVFELEEAYVTFFDLMGVVVPESKMNLGIGALMGKKLISVGKINVLHPEQLNFVDRPVAIQQFFNGSEGLSGEGGQLSYLLPLPFFSQLEAGYWTTSTHAHDEESHEEEGDEHEEGLEEHSGIEFENRLFNTRLWNSFKTSDRSEFELGMSYLIGNAGASSKSEKQHIYGIDLSYTHDLTPNRQLYFNSEFYQARFGHEGEARENQSGGFVSGMIDINKYYSTGIRYGTLSKHGDEGETQTQWSFILSRQLTETSKFRLQYTDNDTLENTVLAQFIFGMGPHSHVLQ